MGRGRSAATPPPRRGRAQKSPRVGEGRAKGKVLEATMPKCESLTTDRNPELGAVRFRALPSLILPGPGVYTHTPRDGGTERAGCSLSPVPSGPQKPALPIHGRGQRRGRRPAGHCWPRPRAARLRGRRGRSWETPTVEFALAANSEPRGRASRTPQSPAGWVWKVSAIEWSRSGALRPPVLPTPGLYPSPLPTSPTRPYSSQRRAGGRSERAAALTWDAPPAQLRRGVWGQLQAGARAGRGGTRRRARGQAQPWPEVAGPRRGIGAQGLPQRDPALAALLRSLSRWPLRALDSFLSAGVGRRLHRRDITSIQALIGRPRGSRCGLSAHKVTKPCRPSPQPIPDSPPGSD